VSNLPSQEFKLFRICLGVNFAAALIFLPLQHFFISPSAQAAMTAIYVACMVSSFILYRSITPGNLRLGAVLLIAFLLAADTLALWMQPPAYKALSFVLVYTFIIVFNLMLVAWPEVVVLDAVLLMTAAGLMFWPASGFAASVKFYGLNVTFAATVALIYFTLLLTLGTALVEVKRRTEQQLRYMNENLNRLVEEKVSEIQRADREARQYQEQVEKILRYSPVGVVITDERFNFLYSNDVHFKLPAKSGNMSEAASGALPLSVLKDMLAEAYAKTCLNGEENLLGQRLEYSGEGGQKILHYSFIRVKLWGETGEATRLVLITEDITREEMLRRKLIHADQLASMGKMAANLAHELGNPLSVIKIYAEFLEQGIADPQKRQEVFEIIRNNLGRINRIIKSILSFARQEKPRKDWVDMQTVLKTTLDMTTHFRHFRNIRIHTEYERDLPQLLVDQHRLAQVFVNLLNNARDAMEEKGGDLYVRCRLEGDEVLVEFQDTGNGIRENNLQNIFTPFFTTKERGLGTGLGLSISYGIVQEHGGRIEVQSREGDGSTFVVHLPVSAPSLPQSDVPKSQEA